jgi:endoglucanase
MLGSRSRCSTRLRVSAAGKGPGLLEAMERRVLLAATLQDGVLSITTAEANDRIAVDRISSTAIQANVNGAIQQFSASAVSRIEIRTGAGNDRVVLGPNLPGTYVFTDVGLDTIYDGTGNDTLTGGANRDVIYGSGGANRINGSGGHDVINGGAGEDRMYGGDGDDRMAGGGGVDRLWGEAGNDTMSGNSSNDKLRGGPGHDSLLGGTGADIIDGEADIDTTTDDGDGDEVISVEALIMRTLTSAIRFNSLGYIPDRSKGATMLDDGLGYFSVVRSSDGVAVFTGAVKGPKFDPDTGDSVFTANFSVVQRPDTYYLNLSGIGRTVDFKINDTVYDSAFVAAMRGFYYWRSNTAVSGTYDGEIYAHAADHPSDGYLDFVSGVHIRRDGTGGWFDAGDYNKYVVNAGVTLGVLMRGYEDFDPSTFQARLGIPESANGVPDYLDEVRWELNWLLKMQAPDGSVYHKLSALNFNSLSEMPEEEDELRYFAPWSSAATADFVAVMAQASRIFKSVDPTFAATALSAARRSYDFLVAHPGNHLADLSAFHTGEYQTDDADDRLWAAAELWETTGEEKYLVDFENRAAGYGDKVDTDFDWNNVKNLGMITYVRSERGRRNAGIVADVQGDLMGAADSIVQTRGSHAYGRPLGNSYYWGANGSVARQAVVLYSAWWFTGNGNYMDTVADAITHLLGRNYYGRSYVTGVGVDPPVNPHDRRSAADDVAAPWPGYLVGGGWPGGTDWVDDQASYQTNEIAINWNAALVYALGVFSTPAAAPAAGNPYNGASLGTKPVARKDLFADRPIAEDARSVDDLIGG